MNTLKKHKLPDLPPETDPELNPIPDPEDPLTETDPDVTPFEDPFDTPPAYTEPEPGEGP